MAIKLRREGSRLVLIAIFNVLIQLSRWNIFNFPVFVLHFQKSFKQSYILFSFLSDIFVFVFQKYILQPSKQKQTFPHAFSKCAGFCANGSWVTLSSVCSFIVSEISWLALLIGWMIVFHSEILLFVLLIGYKQNQCKSYSLWFLWINLNTYEINRFVLLWGVWFSSSLLWDRVYKSESLGLE